MSFQLWDSIRPFLHAVNVSNLKAKVTFETLTISLNAYITLYIFRVFYEQPWMKYGNGFIVLGTCFAIPPSASADLILLPVRATHQCFRWLTTETGLWKVMVFPLYPSKADKILHIKILESRRALSIVPYSEGSPPSAVTCGWTASSLGARQYLWAW